MTFFDRIYAAGADDIVGTIENPLAGSYGGFTEGFTPFLSNILRLVFMVAGIYAFVNLILAGFGYMSAGGDAKAMQKALDKIWQTFLGLAIIAGSFVLAALMGQILFNNPMYILNPMIYGPK